MARIPIGPLNDDNPLNNDKQIDSAYPISNEQLVNAKVFSSRESYIDSLPDNLRYMEIGVAWGYYSEIVANKKNPSVIDLMDWYNQDLRCWSWRAFGLCKCEGMKHTLDYTPETHQQYIIDKFSKYSNVNTIKGDSVALLPQMSEKEYDYIYLDIQNHREKIRPTLWSASKLVPVGGIIGLNDYVIYDGIIEDKPYGTFQVANEFLYKNNNWEVDAIALHVLGFFDIYLKRKS